MTFLDYFLSMSNDFVPYFSHWSGAGHEKVDIRCPLRSFLYDIWKASGIYRPTFQEHFFPTALVESAKFRKKSGGCTPWIFYLLFEYVDTHYCLQTYVYHPGKSQKLLKFKRQSFNLASESCKVLLTLLTQICGWYPSVVSMYFSTRIHVTSTAIVNYTIGVDYLHKVNFVSKTMFFLYD